MSQSDANENAASGTAVNSNPQVDDIDQSTQIELLFQCDEITRRPQLQKLLRLLYQAPRTGEHIAAELKLDNLEYKKKMQTVRDVCSDLKEAIASFYTTPIGTSQPMRCEMLNLRGPSSDHLHYRLKFAANETGGRSPRSAAMTKAFWSSHIDRNADVRSIAIYVSVPTFYRNPKSDLVFRFMDVNIEGNNYDLAIKALETHRGGGALGGGFPSSLYILAGEIEARDNIERWFRRNHGDVLIDNRKCLGITKTTEEFETVTAVILGHPRVSFLADSVLAHSTFELPYSVHRNGAIEIKTKGTSLGTMKRLRAENVIFSKDEQSLILTDKTPNGAAYAVVTRVRNPAAAHDGCPLTLISCDYSRALRRVASLLTDDNSLRNMGDLTRWDSSWPPSFQLLIKIPINHRGEPHDKPTLLAWSQVNDGKKPTGRRLPTDE